MDEAYVTTKKARVPHVEAAAGPPSRSTPIPFFLSDRYEDIQFLGEGGMGIVYRARDPRLGRLVAVKLLKGGDAEQWQRFIAEARAQALVEHENVCHVYDTGETNGQPFIAMQYIDGKPLSEIAERLSVHEQVSVIEQIASAVHEAHRHGIIHRDIKPANILVEEQDGGRRKPYILDFGLARQIGARGPTQSGVVIGTLAYMSPEQARGDSRALDRRSDVFSLGATLYDLIADRAPFVSDEPLKLLFKIMNGDAPRLGSVKAGVPPALETIVMKCLEREPSRRYESALALAQDLKRYLDGEAIAAKPPSLPRLLQKVARRHKAATAAIGALLLGALVLGGVWLHAERRARERARIAQELGVAVKEMELFLRAAYELPRHDVEREREMVRARLAELSEQTAAAGDAGEGPRHYALGRGYLALGRPDVARDHLARALDAGYSTPELHYALGVALGALFQRALAETKRITGEDARRERVAELERELRDPALSHLRSAGEAKIEVPVYAEGLIALHEGRNEDAAAKAREAFAKAPWMYEAKKLEGDAMFAEGSKYRHDAAFDYDRMKGYFDQAERAYLIAADIGRSDPSIFLAECELWEKTGWADYNKGLPFAEPLRVADAACQRAMEASSRDGGAMVQRAMVLSARIYEQMLDASSVSEGTLALAEEAVNVAEDGEAASPDGDVMAHYAVAQALGQRARVLHALGQEAWMDEAIDAYERVLSLDPSLTWALNELGDALVSEALQEEARGQDGAAAIASAIDKYDRAIALDPRFALPVSGRLIALTTLIKSRLERGRDAEAPLQTLLSSSAALEKASFGPWMAAFWKARSHRLRAQVDLALGRDPTAAIAGALDAIRAFAGGSTDDPWLLEDVAQCGLLEATYALREGKDPLPAAARARDAARKALEKDPLLELLLAQIEVVAARGRAGEPGARPDIWDPALSRLAPLLARPERDPEPFALAAEVYARRAATAVKAGQSADEDMRRGLAMADAALQMNPVMAKALLARGYLYLLQAQEGRTEAARAEAARRADEAFGAAIRNNPMLSRELGAAPDKSPTMPR